MPNTNFTAQGTNIPTVATDLLSAENSSGNASGDSAGTNSAHGGDVDNLVSNGDNLVSSVSGEREPEQTRIAESPEVVQHPNFNIDFSDFSMQPQSVRQPQLIDLPA